MPADQCGPENVDAALDRLALAAPIIKKNLIEAGARVVGADGTNLWINATQYSTFTVTVTNNAIIGITNGAVVPHGQRLLLQVKQSPPNATWQLSSTNGNLRFGMDITALSVVSNSWISLVFDANSNYWDVVSDIRGY